MDVHISRYPNDDVSCMCISLDFVFVDSLSRFYVSQVARPSGRQGFRGLTAEAI